MTFETKLQEQYKEGWAAGVAEGIEKGKSIVVHNLLNDGIISLEQADSLLGVSTEQIKELLSTKA